MYLGFDEVYVLVKARHLLYNECLYDSRKADEEVDRLTNNGSERVVKMSLEQYIERIDQRIKMSAK